MSTAMENPLDALTALLEERARYEQWLAQLEDRRSQTPPHVFDRVRRDYAGRLDDVMTQLRSRATDLDTSVASLDERVNALLAAETARRDARAEVELRAMVGEYETARAESELAACDADIDRLERERTEIASELHRMQQILALVRQPAATAPAAPPAPVETPRAAPPSGSFDELAFLHSVVDRPAPAAASEPASPVNGPMSLDRQVPEPAIRPLGTMRSAPTPNATPAFLKDMPTEQVKTLKCQECGTMNYPTEWYCERCGGELAAM
jgi:hypothetical protein